MRPQTEDEKREVLEKLISALSKAREIAGTADLPMLAFMIALAGQEALSQLETIEEDSRD
jgi:hypothetical protein